MSRYQDFILEMIDNAPDHPTADQIFLAMKQKYPGAAMATVYNNLKSLSEKGKIRRMKVEGRADCYDSTKPHDHLVCSKCGRLSDIQLPDLQQQLSEMCHHKIEAYDLRLFWVCPECEAEMAENLPQ